MPPEALVPDAVQDFRVQQSGKELRLTWSAPSMEKGGRPLRDLSGFRIFKRIIAGDGADCASCPDSWNLFASVDSNDPGERGKSGSTYIQYDNNSASGKTRQYRMIAISKSGGISSPATSPAIKFHPPLSAPALKTAVLPASIKLEFAFDSNGKGRLAGFNVYRRSDKTTLPLLPFNRLPIKENAWEDLQIEYGHAYSYSVTALVEIEGEIVESLRSDETELLFTLQEIR